MIRIIIHGCGGKMGRVVASVAQVAKGFEVVAGVDLMGDPDADFPVYERLEQVKEQADVVIDFSLPEALPELLKGAVSQNLPVVIATTGLDEQHREMMETAARNIPVFQAANMSLGVNLLKVLVKQTASVLGAGFDIEIVEKHHKTKRDSPSGTALAFADALKSVLKHEVEYTYGRKHVSKLREPKEIGIHAVRGGNIVGEHDIIFAGTDEMVTLQHTAYSKGLFAAGALKAAEYLMQKNPGFYLMDQMIAEQTTVTNLYTSDEALISFKRIPSSLGTSHNIFEQFSKQGINIDMISQNVTDEGFHSLSFSIDDQDSSVAQEILDQMNQEDPRLKGTLFPNLCKLTVEGLGMETQSGVASAVFGILDVHESTAMAVTTSETKISLIIDAMSKNEVVADIKERYELS